MSKKKKKGLPKIDQPIEGLTCFKAHATLKVDCVNKECRYWQKMDEPEHRNCVILAAKAGPLTLQEVGNIFNVTRMRICQIEKVAKQFLKSSAPKILSD